MRGLLRFVGGALLGGAIGAGIAILMAPAPGPEVKNRLRSEVEAFRGEIQKAAEERRKELEAQLEQLRAKA